MVLYRISKKEYIKDLSGIGAGLYGGRWNPKGINLVYTSGNIALAYVEFLVHNYHILRTTNVCLAEIKTNEDVDIKEIKINELPQDWKVNPAASNKTQVIGSKFVKDCKAYILKVPSAVVPGEFNYLLNPMYKLHSKTKILKIVDPFSFDTRLIGVGT